MSVYKESFIFSRQIRELVKSPALLEVLNKYLAEWRLYQWEDALLYEIFPLSGEVGEEDFAEAGQLLKVMRGEVPEATDISRQELENEEEFVKKFLDDELYQKRVIRTIYFAVNRANSPRALGLLANLEELLVENKRKISLDMLELVMNMYIALSCYFYNDVDEVMARYLFQRAPLVRSVSLGYDWEYILRAKFDSMIVFENRKWLAMDLAHSLTLNDDTVGRDNLREAKPVKYWIDNFRIYSKNDFGGGELLNFTEDRNYFGACTAEEKGIIKEILQLYTHLVNGFLIVPGGDFESLEKKMGLLEKYGLGSSEYDYFELQKKMEAQRIREMVDREFKQDAQGNYNDLGGVLDRLAELALEKKNPNITDLYYFDEQKNSFVWGDKV